MHSDDFLSELGQLVARRSAAGHLVDTLAFVGEVAERLEEDPVFGEFEPAEYQGTGANGRALRLHGFTRLDDVDGSIGLVIGKWDEPGSGSTIGTTAVDQLTGRLENFVREAIDHALHMNIAEANPAYELALQLHNEAHRISRIRLHIFTNQALSGRFREEQRERIAGIAVERHIWDLKRLTALYASSREREAVHIDFEDSGFAPIPCLIAARTDDLCSYLCVVPGELLADLFERYGSRLLEGNVRSFLGMKGGVNKGIRTTIHDVPNLFFAYNNGIAATASEVVVESRSGQLAITALTGLQIVNGGQTTASILSARKKDKLSLTGVSVQMKLTRVLPAAEQELIPKIAEYANTQNKVAAADFFANHPFHRKMEEVSRRLLTPAKAGQRIQSKWFYERSRGQFQNERMYLTPSAKTAFEAQYPPHQLVSKTDLAKYAHTLEGRPHWVSLGAQKNFSKFAARFSSKSLDVTEAEHWEKISPEYGDDFYKATVALALVWRKMEHIVDGARDAWYEGGYRINIVTYTVAKLFHDVGAAGGAVDLERIWSSQDAGPEITERLEQLAPAVQQTLLRPPPGVRNVGEWCKKEECWKSIAELEVPWTADLRRIAVSKSDHVTRKADSRKQGHVDDAIELQRRVYEMMSSGYWTALHGWSKQRDFLASSELELVARAGTVTSFLKILQKDYRKLMLISKGAEEEGFRGSSKV
jgi:hypothetical protein